MAKAASKVDLMVVDKPVEVEPEPWYQLAGWWEGLDDEEIDARVQSVTEPYVWIVVPPGYLSRLDTRRLGLKQELGEDAWDIYMELTRKNGYSPTHAQQAWDGARDFKAKGEET